MPVTAETTGLDDLTSWADGLTTTFKEAAASEVMAASEQSIEYVSSIMPVDTGWAQSRWGDPAVPGGIFDVSEDGLTIEMGSDLKDQLDLFEYITRLNEGSSKQAPAGFIDVAAERAGDGLEARLNEIADMVE